MPPLGTDGMSPRDDKNAPNPEWAVAQPSLWANHRPGAIQPSDAAQEEDGAIARAGGSAALEGAAGSAGPAGDGAHAAATPAGWNAAIAGAAAAAATFAATPDGDNPVLANHRVAASIAAAAAAAQASAAALGGQPGTIPAATLAGAAFVLQTTAAPVAAAAAAVPAAAAAAPVAGGANPSLQTQARTAALRAAPGWLTVLHKDQGGENSENGGGTWLVRHRDAQTFIDENPLLREAPMRRGKSDIKDDVWARSKRFPAQAAPVRVFNKAEAAARAAAAQAAAAASQAAAAASQAAAALLNWPPTSELANAPFRPEHAPFERTFDVPNSCRKQLPAGAARYLSAPDVKGPTPPGGWHSYPTHGQGGASADSSTTASPVHRKRKQPSSSDPDPEANVFGGGGRWGASKPAAVQAPAAPTADAFSLGGGWGSTVEAAREASAGWAVTPAAAAAPAAAAPVAAAPAAAAAAPAPPIVERREHRRRHIDDVVELTDTGRQALVFDKRHTSKGKDRNFWRHAVLWRMEFGCAGGWNCERGYTGCNLRLRCSATTEQVDQGLVEIRLTGVHRSDGSSPFLRRLTGVISAEQRLAFALGLHDRCGGASPVQVFTHKLLDVFCESVLERLPTREDQMAKDLVRMGDITDANVWEMFLGRPPAFRFDKQFSSFNGLTWLANGPNKRKWRVRVRGPDVNGKAHYIHVGHFPVEEEVAAAHAFDAEAKRIKGADFNGFNFNEQGNR